MDEPGTSSNSDPLLDTYLSTTTDEDPAEWLHSIRDKLYSMFCSPMKEEYTHEAFKWVSHLCISVGDFSWISPNGSWNTNEVRIFTCIAHLSLTEIHILLPLIQRHLTSGEEPDLEDGKVLARSANLNDYDKFGNHLVILESVIKSLVKGQTDECVNDLADKIKGSELKNLLERLKEALALICEYLELVHSSWFDLTKDQTSEKFSSAEAALRITCVWLSEDPCGFEPQCKRFLIDLIIKHLLIDGSSKNDLLVLALHSVCTDSEDMMSSLKETTEHEAALEKYLAYVQAERRKSSGDRRNQKIFKLRCGLVKDLISQTVGSNRIESDKKIM